MYNSQEKEYSGLSFMENVNDYGSAEYWEQRYQKSEGQRFDWLQNFDTLKSLIYCELGYDKQKRILNLGCGNGEIQDQLYEDGYQNIVNNDFSAKVIDQMEKHRKLKGYDKMQYHLMDATNMKDYEDQSFDMVFDKSTIDALLCSEKPYINTAKMLEEVERVLKDNGVYLIISYGSPESRIQHLQRSHISFTFTIEQLQRQNQEGCKLIHYAYICRKNGKKQAHDKQWLQNFYAALEELEKQDYQ